MADAARCRDGVRTITTAVLDGQKLRYHTETLEQWVRGEEVWPVYFEIGPTSACNCRCLFCAYDYLHHGGQYLAVEPLKAAMVTLTEHGAKSCMFAGEGEPLLHPHLAELVAHARDGGLDVAITTNLLAADEPLLEALLPRLAWIRCSLNATDAAQYQAVHRAGAGAFDRVWSNLAAAVAIRDRGPWPVTVGVQCVVLAENIAGVADFARRLAELGVDYLSLKPAIQHPKMTYRATPITDAQWDDTVAAARGLVGNQMSVIARQASRARATKPQRPYDHCLGLPFFVEIISDGRVFSCGPMLGDDRFCYGNINEQSFADIWQGPRRRDICRHAAEELDVSGCMPACRLDQVNAFLWSLKHPPAHVNFI